MKKMILPVVVLAVFGLLFAGCADAYVADITACAKIKLAEGTINGGGFYQIDLTDEQMALVLSKDAFYFGIDLTAKPAAGGQFRFITNGSNWSPDWYFSQNAGPVEGNASFAEGDEGGRLTVDVWAAMAGAGISGVPTSMSIILGYWGALSIDEIIADTPNAILYVKK